MRKKNLRRKARFVHMLTTLLAILMVPCTIHTPWITRGERLATQALEYLGVPYVFNTKGPDRFDCSGFLVYLFADYGISLNHSAEEIGTNPDFLTISNPLWLRVGDIVCFDTVDDKDPSDHVGIWLGGNRFVHASSTGKAVIVSELDGFYLETFTWGKRILRPCQ